MKTTKFLLVAATMFAVMTLNATRVTEPVKSEAWAKYNAVNSCGITAAQVTSYLENCSHHHSVSYVTPIEGTYNFTAGIENCGTATVYVTADGIITGHADQTGICGG